MRIARAIAARFRQTNRPARPRTAAVRRDVYRRRLLCEPLEDRRLLSVGISGQVWGDLNSNGIQDTGETGLAGAVVEVYSSNDTTVGDADDVFRGLAISDASGNYAFSGLPNWLYYYEVFRTPVGYTFTTQDAGSDDTLDSDAGPSGVTALFIVATDQTDNTRDAGLVGAAPTFGFALRIGATDNDYGQAVATDAAGNVYIAGTFDDTIDFDPGPGVCNLTEAGGGDIYVAKYSSAGALVWARRMGGIWYDVAYSVTVAGDGSVYTTGCFSGTVDFDPGTVTFNLTSAGNDDIFVSKLDSSGNFVWARRMGGVSSDSSKDIAVAADGSVYTTGCFLGTADFDPGSGTMNLTSLDGYAVFVSKLNAAGDYVWARCFSSTNWSRGNSIAVANDGSVYTTGDFQYTVDFDPGSGVYNLTSAGISDIFILKLDPSGNFFWARRMGATSSDSGQDIAVATDGSVYTTGAFQGTVDFDPGAATTNLTSLGGYDVFISELNAAGEFVWARRMGGSGEEYGRGIAVADNGYVYTTGPFSATADFDPGPATFNLTNAGYYDVFLSELDSAGNFVDAYRMGGSDDESSFGVATFGSGSVYIVGSFSGTADFDPGSGVFNLVNAGDDLSYDAFLLKLLINHAPTDIALSANSVAENQPSGTTVGTVGTTDPDAGNTFTYTLVAGTGSTDNASFTISGGTLQTAASFDYEAKSSYSIRVRSTDQGGLWTEKAFTIAVANVNESPTWIFLVLDGSLPENQPASTVVGQFGTTDPDGGDSASYTLVAGTGNADNASFTIDAGGQLLTAAPLDFETQAACNIRVRITDLGGLYIEKTFIIDLADVNESPTDISLSGASVAENLPSGTTVGTLGTTDPDADSTFTYSLVTGTGSTDNAWFTISGNAMQTAAAFNYEAKSSYSIRVRSTDQGGLWTEKAFAIAVTNVDEAPAAAVDTPSAPKNGNVVVSYLLSDPESDACSVVVEYSLDSGEHWHPATAGSGGDGTAGLAASLAGTSHTYVWASAADIVNADNANVMVRVTPSNALAGTAGISGGFAVNNYVRPLHDWTTPGLYDPVRSRFYLRNENSSGTANHTFAYGPGGAGWIPLSGDWDATSTETTGLYDPALSRFYLRNDNSSGYATKTFSYGPGGAGWQPVVGDWDGDGIDTVGLYNPATSRFYLRNTNTSGMADITFSYGPAGGGWTPLVGDWDGDGIDTVGLYNPATSRFYLHNTNSIGTANVTFIYGPGGAGWTPLAGDWDANGDDTIGLYSPSTSRFYLRYTNTNGMADTTFSYGPVGSDWTPLVGDWDGSSWTSAGTASNGTYPLETLVGSWGVDPTTPDSSDDHSWVIVDGDDDDDGFAVVGDGDRESPLLAADGVGNVSDATPLTVSALQSVVAEAMARWSKVALVSSAISALDGIKIELADLPDAQLAVLHGSTISLDHAAAGHGWFADDTAGQDEEFAGDEMSRLSAVDPRAVDRIDLLTVVEHELGHALGVLDLDSSLDGLMSNLLSVGVRRITA